jgi:hypothetical protein
VLFALRERHGKVMVSAEPGGGADEFQRGI